ECQIALPVELRPEGMAIRLPVGAWRRAALMRDRLDLAGICPPQVHILVADDRKLLDALLAHDMAAKANVTPVVDVRAPEHIKGAPWVTRGVAAGRRGSWACDVRNCVLRIDGEDPQPHRLPRSAVTRIDQPGEGDLPPIVDRIAKEGAAELPTSRGRSRIRHDDLTGRTGALVEAKDASSPEVGTAPDVREGD